MTAGISPVSTPVSFDPEPAVAVVSPLPLYPDGGGVRATLPAAGDPDVAVSVPPVVSPDPDELRPRSHTLDLDYGNRRRHADVDAAPRRTHDARDRQEKRRERGPDQNEETIPHFDITLLSW